MTNCVTFEAGVAGAASAVFPRTAFGHHIGISLQLISWGVLWFLYQNLYLAGQYYHRTYLSAVYTLLSYLLLFFGISMLAVSTP